MQRNFSGAKPVLTDHRDYDFHKMFGNVGVIKYPIFDPSYLCDANLTMFCQNIENDYFTPPVPAEYNGCTNYCQADCSTDCDGHVKNPAELEAITHANALGGYDVRQSFIKAVQLGWFSFFFNIKKYGPLDWFDAFRVAQTSGMPEKRSISWATPWFPSWENACNPYMNPSGIMPMPTDDELAKLREDIRAFSWHNSKLDGWLSVQGRLVYRNKSWQGNAIGNKGFIYFPREVINVVMDIPGTAAFTGTRLGIGTPQTISVTVIQWVASRIRNLFGYNSY